MNSIALHFRKYLLVGSCLLFVSPIFSQVDTTEILAKLCQGYLTEERQTIADTTYTVDAAGEIFSPSMAEYLAKRFLHQNLIGRPMIMHPNRNAIPYFEKNKMGCRLTFPGAADAFADIIPTDRGLRVAGINGEIIGESQIRYIDSVLLGARAISIGREELYSFTQTFVRAANGFWQEGNSDSLSLLCSPKYMSILKMGKEADSLEQTQRLAWNLKNQNIDWFGGDTAVAILEIGYYGQVILYLARTEEKWQVFGEKGLIGNEKNVELKRQELELLREKAALQRTIENELNLALAAYFQRENEDSLRQLCSASFFQSMEKIKLKFGKINPNFLEVEGMTLPVNLDEKIRLRNDSAWVYRHEDTIYFSLEKGQWQCIGFNQFVELPATEAYVEDNYNSLLFFWGIKYSSLNDDATELYLPETGEEDTMTYHFMTDFMLFEAKPEVSEGIWSYMESKMKSPKPQQNNSPQFVYLAFLVEPDGNLSDIQVLNSAKKRWTKKAKAMLAEMPAWSPAQVNDQNVKMYRVLAVPVY